MDSHVLMLVGWAMDFLGFCFLLRGWANPMPVCGFGDYMGIDTNQEEGEERVIVWEKRNSTSYFKQPNRIKRDICTAFIGIGLLIQFLATMFSCS